MTNRIISVCPSTLTEGFDTHCPKALRTLFDGRRVSHQLDFTWEDDEAADVDALLERTVAYASGIVEVGGRSLGGRSERLDGIGLWGDVGNDFQTLAVGHGEGMGGD